MTYIHWPQQALPAHPGQQITAALARLAQVLARLAQVLAAELRRHRAARALRDLDTRMLADIGLRYDEIDRAVRFGRDGVLARRRSD